MMFGDVAKNMMRIIGKDYNDQGIVTVADLPEAIAKLRAAIERDKALHAANAASLAAMVPDEDEEKLVSTTQRALPLVALFESSLQHDVPVVWGAKC
jgi:uncharacterized small protein (DUF1192 family)